MKPYRDLKKYFSLFFNILLIGIFLIPLFSLPSFSSAQTTAATNLQNQIDQKNGDIATLEQQIAGYQSQLDTLGQQTSSLKSSLAELDINSKKLIASIDVTQNQIDETNLTIDDLSSQINDKQDSISNATDAIALNIQQENEFDEQNIVEVILSENDFTSIWNDIDSVATVRDTIRQSIINLKQAKGDLEDTRQQSIDAKNKLTALRSQLSDQKKIVDQNTTDKNKLLAQTKNSESTYQKLLADGLAKETSFENDLRNYESQLQYVLNPASLPSGGVLSWPLSNIFVTQQFGKTEAGRRLYANGTHNGTDFRASIGTPVMAMADGVVDGTGDTDIQCPKVSFGRFILIKYNNGLAATFGHLSLIKVVKGESVTRGEIVGYSGSTGYVTAPHLHVSVYARDAVSVQTLPSKSCPGRVLTQPIAPVNAYLDPLFYLPPTTSNMFKKDI